MKKIILLTVLLLSFTLLAQNGYALFNAVANPDFEFNCNNLTTALSDNYNAPVWVSGADEYCYYSTNDTVTYTPFCCGGDCNTCQSTLRAHFNTTGADPFPDYAYWRVPERVSVFMVVDFEVSAGFTTNMNSTNPVRFEFWGEENLLGQVVVQDGRHKYEIYGIVEEGERVTGYLNMKSSNWNSGQKVPSTLKVYSFNIGYVDTDEAHATLPSDAYRQAMCGVPPSTWDCSNCCLSCESGAGTVDNTTLTWNIYGVYGSGIPCHVYYHDGVLHARTPMATKDYDVAHGFPKEYNPTIYMTDNWIYQPDWTWTQTGSHPCYYRWGGFAMFTKDYLFTQAVSHLTYCYPTSGSTVGDAWFITDISQTDFYGTKVLEYTHGGIGGTITADVSGTVSKGAVTNNSDGVWNGHTDISLYNLSGTEMTISWGHSTSEWIPFDYDAGVYCEPSWWCTGNQEYFLTSTCDVISQEHCGSCGCQAEGEGFMCVSAYDHWECESEYENWHYDENCTQDVQVICDIECLDGECVGETLCTEHEDCSPYCYGDVSYFAPFCDYGTYTCNWFDNYDCSVSYGCNPATGLCYDEPPPAPMSPIFVDDQSPVGIIGEIRDGMFGFLSQTAHPIFSILFIVIVAIFITALFSLVVAVAKKIGSH